MPALLTTEESFWLRVDKRGPDECWPWTGWRNHKGYGSLCRNGRADKRVYVKATHISWEIANGQSWPEGKLALHSCDNPPCVNPRHIRPGTYAENAADRNARGRTWRKGRPIQPKPSPNGGAISRGRPEYCRRCGHHRTDDLRNKLKNGISWRCRNCHRMGSQARKARLRSTASEGAA